MKLSIKEIRHLSLLSRLEIEDAKSRGLNKDIQKILDYIENLNKIDVSNTEPTLEVTGLINSAREDIVAECENPREILSCAPESHNNFVKVKAVLE